MVFLWALLLVDVAMALLAVSLTLGLSFIVVWAALSIYCTARNIPHSPGVLAVAAEAGPVTDPGLPLLRDTRYTY